MSCQSTRVKKPLMSSIIENTFSLESDKLPTIEELSKEITFDVRFDLIDSYNFLTSTLMLKCEYGKKSCVLLSHELILSMKSIFSEFENIHELACGVGWLTYWLRKYGVDIKTCTDDMSRDDFEYMEWVEKKSGVEAVRENDDADLFIVSWPYMDDTCFDIWSNMKTGQHLLYIGEDHGCTANAAFFKSAYESECEIEGGINKDFRSFFGIHDRMVLYKK